MRPDGVSAEDFAALAQRAAGTIGSVVNPALQKHANWYLESYRPACNKAPGVSAQPGGEQSYEFRVRQQTTTGLTANEIHDIGLAEVARIRAEMVAVAKAAGYDSREAFIEHLRTDPQYYATTPEELMEKVARETKTIDGNMPALFGKLPRLPYGIKEIPAETAEGTTTAYYMRGSPEIGIAGFYYVNTSKLDQRPLWEIPALSLHEAVPGHHHQIALQQELPLSDFRKHGAFFTAFVEGWVCMPSGWGSTWGCTTPLRKRWAGCPMKCGAPVAWSSIPASAQRTGSRHRPSPTCRTIPRCRRPI